MCFHPIVHTFEAQSGLIYMQTLQATDRSGRFAGGAGREDAAKGAEMLTKLQLPLILVLLITALMIALWAVWVFLPAAG